MRKTINHFFAIAATAMLLNLPQSCSMDENMHNSQNSPDDNSISSDVLMISEQEFISASMTETLSQKKHPQFYTAALAQQINNSTALVQAKTSSETETSAPLMEIEEIPIWRNNKRTVRVYENGNVEIENEFPLYEEFMKSTLINAVESVTDQRQTVSKSVYSDGMMSLYNNEGELLYSMPVQMPDFSSLIDSAAIEQIQNSPQLKSGDASDMHIIRERILQTSGDAFSISKLEQNATGNIVLEQVSKDGSTRICTMLSEDLTKTYNCSIFKNGLLQSRSCSYYAQDIRNFSMTMSRTGTDTPQPCTTITQTLVFKNGVPKVHSEYNYYTKNTTIINR